MLLLVRLLPSPFNSPTLLLVLSLPVPPSLPPSSRWAGVSGPLHQAQDARHPPVAGHDDPAGHPAAAVVVGPGVVAPQRLADPLAVGVAAAALGAAHALVVQHGVDVHAALLALQASLSGHTHTHKQRESAEVTPLSTVEITHHSSLGVSPPRFLLLWTQLEERLGSVCVHIVGSLERRLSSLPGPLAFAL